MANLILTDELSAKIERVAKQRAMTPAEWLAKHFAYAFELADPTETDALNPRLLAAHLTHLEDVVPPPHVQACNDAPDLGYQVLNDGRKLMSDGTIAPADQ